MCCWSRQLFPTRMAQFKVSVYGDVWNPTGTCTTDTESVLPPTTHTFGAYPVFILGLWGSHLGGDLWAMNKPSRWKTTFFIPVMLSVPFTFQETLSDVKCLSMQQDSRNPFVCTSGLLHVTSTSSKFGVTFSGKTDIVSVALCISVWYGLLVMNTQL